MMKNTVKSRIISNASWIIACRIVQSLINLFIGMISARYLGPSNYGLINYAGSIVAFLVPIAQLGFRNTLVQEIIDSPNEEGKTIGTVLAMTTASGFLSIAGIAAFVFFVNANETETIVVCLLYSISLIFQMLELVEYWFQAKLLSKYTSVITLIAYIIVSAYKVYLLVTGKSVYWFAVSQALDYFIISFSLILIFLKLSKQHFSVSFKLFRKMFKKSKYYIVSDMMVMIYQHTDKIMIALFLGTRVNGYYSAAVTCAGICAFVFGAIIDSARPIILKSQKIGNETFEQNMKRLYSVLLYLGLLQNLVFTFLAPLVVNILYGKDYSAAVPILRIITWYSTFSYIGSVRNIWILAKGKQKYLLIINFLGAVLNVIGNLVLIPLLGANGAAVASVATYMFANVVLCLVLKPLRPTVKLMLQALNPKLLWDMIPKRKNKTYSK